MHGALLRVFAFSAVLFVAACDGSSPTIVDAAIEIDARVIDARLVIDRDQANLGMVILGETTPEVTFNISNPGRDETGPLVAAVTGEGFRKTRDTCGGMTLEPAASCQVAVEATPAAAGQVSGNLKVNATPGGEVNASLTATGLTPGALTAMPDNIPFGTITAGTNSPATMITIRNTGQGPTGVVVVNLGGPDASEFEITNNGCLAMGLAPDATCLVMVRMRPPAMSTGAKTAMVTAMSTPGGATVTTLTGTVERPAVIAVTGSGAFGGILVGTSATRTLTVSNTGAQVTGVVTITRTGSASFQVLTGMAGDCESGVTTLMPGAMCSVRVRFTAGIPGAVIGTITASGMPGGSAMGSLTGTGQRPALLTGDLTTSFGMVEVTTLSTNMVQWSIMNSGDQPTSVPMLTIGNPELVATANTCTAALAGGASCAVTLRFMPSAGGARSAMATVAVNGSMVTATATATGAFRVTLTRTGDSGTVTSTPAGFNCAPPGFSCTALFAPGNITLRARTSNGSLVYFAGWSGASAGACAAGPLRDCQLTVDGAEAITATFNAMTVNLAFVSSTTQPTNLGGTAPYDAVCNALATAAGINDAGGSNYVAWVSDANSNALARLGLAGGWVRMDGRIIALNRADLIANQKILNPVRYSETGDDLADTTLLTGTLPDGTVAPASHCANWSATGGGAQMTTGNGMGGPTFWSAGQTTACSVANYPVLCLMKQNVGGPGAAPTSMGKRLWLSNAAYGPSPTGDVDAVCNADRPAGVAMGRALVARTTTTAASLLTAAAMYVRPDGQEVGTGAEIVSGETRGGIWQSGNGTYWSGQAWTGSGTIDTLAIFASNCGDWTVPNTSGRYTFPGLARRLWGTNQPVIVCNNIPVGGPRLQCYEP